MKVAIDSGPLTSGHAVRGIGVHTRELIEELQKLRTKNFQIDAVNFCKTEVSKYDIVHYTSFHPFFITLPFRRIYTPSNSITPKVIVTIHDLIPLIYPKHYPPGLKGSIKFFIQKLLIKKADAIITISETSKKDIVRFLGVNPEKVHVIYLAPNKMFKPITDQQTLFTTKKKYNLPDKFVLYVGDVNYNKNIPNLIKACGLVNIPLVIVGKQAQDIDNVGVGLEILSGPMDWLRYIFNLPHPELAHYESISKSFKNNSNVLRLGFVPNEDLVDIYNLASVYCQPSFYEGFGLPVLEAVACGTPVVVSRTQALVEIAAGAATFVNPKSPLDIARGFNNLITNPKLPRNYLWEKTAQETLDVYRKVFVNK